MAGSIVPETQVFVGSQCVHFSAIGGKVGWNATNSILKDPCLHASHWAWAPYTSHNQSGGLARCQPCVWAPIWACRRTDRRPTASPTAGKYRKFTHRCCFSRLKSLILEVYWICSVCFHPQPSPLPFLSWLTSDDEVTTDCYCDVMKIKAKGRSSATRAVAAERTIAFTGRGRSLGRVALKITILSRCIFISTLDPMLILNTFIFYPFF